MNTCDYCTHVEMCGWRKELNEGGCEFYDDGNKWIPVKWHVITDEERQREEYPEEWVYHLDCIMPADEQEILVTIKGRKSCHVEKDTCYIDDGYSLDSGYDWCDDVIAWMPLPEPYKAESEE